MKFTWTTLQCNQPISRHLPISKITILTFCTKTFCAANCLQLNFYLKCSWFIHCLLSCKHCEVNIVNIFNYCAKSKNTHLKTCRIVMHNHIVVIDVMLSKLVWHMPSANLFILVWKKNWNQFSEWFRIFTRVEIIKICL